MQHDSKTCVLIDMSMPPLHSDSLIHDYNTETQHDCTYTPNRHTMEVTFIQMFPHAGFFQENWCQFTSTTAWALYVLWAIPPTHNLKICTWHCVYLHATISASVSKQCGVYRSNTNTCWPHQIPLGWGWSTGRCLFPGRWRPPSGQRHVFRSLDPYPKEERGKNTST